MAIPSGDVAYTASQHGVVVKYEARSLDLPPEKNVEAVNYVLDYLVESVTFMVVSAPS